MNFKQYNLQIIAILWREDRRTTRLKGSIKFNQRLKLTLVAIGPLPAVVINRLTSSRWRQQIVSTVCRESISWNRRNLHSVKMSLFNFYVVYGTSTRKCMIPYTPHWECTPVLRTEPTRSSFSFSMGGVSPSWQNLAFDHHLLLKPSE